MSLWTKLFGEEKEPEQERPTDHIAEEEELITKFHDEEIPGTLDLGWYYSEDKDEYQMAKIAQKDRATHLYVIGATGTGKTKFLQFLIQQDIEKGNGFGVIDPHGDLIEDIKGSLTLHYDPSEKEISERVILIDPTDPNFTVTFNPLEKLPNVLISEQGGELISAFRKIWSDSWGVRMEDLMRNSLIALGEAELTLVELPHFLTSRPFREAVLEKVSHPVTQDYFQRFDTLTDRGQATWIEPVMNKANAFLSDERIRQMFSYPKSSFNIREIMDQKKMLLIKLDKGKLKDAADLLGSLLMAKIQMAAFSRSDVPQSRRTPFHLYIDEFQTFASESFMVILSEARKYGLCLIMAHQTLSQIPEELRSLILGNTGVQVYFRVNRHDAQLLAKEGFEYSGYEVKTMRLYRGPEFWSLGEEWEHYTEALQNLPPRVCYAKHKIEGGIIPFRTVEIEPAWEALGMNEEEYSQFLIAYPFGRNYLISRQELGALPYQRQRLIEERVREKPPKEKRLVEVPPKPHLEKVERPVKKEVAVAAIKEKAEVRSPESEEKGKSQHRYLQTLIRRMAEEKGFRAIIEQPTPDGTGRVDVSLEHDGRKIACEISVTTTDEHEFSNIEKCLMAGYEKVVVCSPEKKTLEKIKTFVTQRLKEADKERVLFFQPEDLFFYLEKEAASLAGKEERIKGYKVKVQYQPVIESEKKTRREAVGQVILQALRRMKEGKWA
jgi:hypothetical protein